MPGPRRLVDWPWVVVEVECSLCRRCGRYRLARLAERFGAAIELTALLRALAGRCGLDRPGVKSRQYEARCGVRYRVPAGGPRPDGADAREARPGEVWPPRVQRLGPTGPLPTIGDTRRHGITHVRVCCEALIGGVMCWRMTEVPLDALGLPDEAVFVDIPRLRRFRCRRCGASKVRVLPSWPDVRDKRLGPDGRGLPPDIPGVTPVGRTPGTEPLSRG